MHIDWLNRLRTLFDTHRKDGKWLALATAIATYLVVLYLFTHSYPAYGGGLFLAIIEKIIASGYHPPAQIPHYTTDGIPFAYPPLLFYIYAVLVDIGIDPMSLMRILPGLVTIAALIPHYYLSRAFLDSRQQAGIATVAFASIPVATQWHMTAGGLIRAPAFLFTLTGLYCSVRLFRSDSRPYYWLLGTSVLFGLTMLSHPQYATFFGIGTLLIYLFFDRTFRGLVYGVLVAGGGIALSAVWWLRVLLVYGLDPILSASGTHGGLLSGSDTLFHLLIGSITWGSAVGIAHIGIIIGVLILLAKRRYFLPVWLIIVTQFTASPRFLLVPGVMLLAVGVTDVGIEGIDRIADRFSVRPNMSAMLILVVMLSTVVGGTAIGGGTVSSAVGSSSSYQSYISDGDVEAMEWVRTETKPAAEFVVIGDIADWFPYFAERTSLVSPWGTEWDTTDQYGAHIEMTRGFAECTTADCLSAMLDTHGLSPEYLYIPAGRITARGTNRIQPSELHQSIVDSDRFHIVRENDEAMVVAVSPLENATV